MTGGVRQSLFVLDASNGLGDKDVLDVSNGLHRVRFNSVAKLMGLVPELPADNTPVLDAHLPYGRC